MAQDDDKKRIEQAEYRAKLIEAELNAIRSSKAYRLSKKIGIIKAQIKSDPVGLSKKAAKMVFTNPRKARHMFRSASRGAFILQSVAEQTAKYQEWILLNEPDAEELDEQAKQAETFKYKPLISIVTPVFNPPTGVFEELIESVLEQTYPNLELCLGNFGDAPEIEELIAKYVKLDARVKSYKFSENLGIAGNSNQILEKVEGEFIALLDHDDTISPNALYENVKLLQKTPYDFIYSDKDKIDEKGNRFDPLFKAEISPEMLLNVNYLTHLNVMRTSIVKDIGGWDPATDGAQDWDLFLRVLAASKHVGFIPKILYHWRVIATSTAMSIETKPYALANQCKAVDKYLALNGIPAHAYVEKTELFLKWDTDKLDAKPLVCVYYSAGLNTQRIIRSIRKRVPDAHIVILTKSEVSMPPSVPYPVLRYASQTFMRTLVDYVDKACKDATTVLFVSDTMRLDKPDWYDKLSGWLTVPGVSAASGRLVDRQDLIVDSGGLVTRDQQYFPLFYKYPRYYQSYIGNAEWVRNLSVLSPNFVALSADSAKQYLKQTDEAVASFDDYCLWVVSQGSRLVMSPHATAITQSEADIDHGRTLLVSKSRGHHQDPYNNPNMAPNDPLRLFDDEVLAGVDASTAQSVDAYQHDAIILADTFDISAEELEKNKKLLASKPEGPVQSVAWFLPGFDAVYAGLMNILSFADYLHEEQGLKTTVYILTGGDTVAAEQAAVVKHFPTMKTAVFVALKPNNIGDIKPHDMGIATQWATTFPLARVTNIPRKHYFIQDNEANFYPKGSISSLVELSYTFGFSAIAGTQGLLDMYKKNYGGDGIVLGSKVDLSSYVPRKDVYYTPTKPYKVFFYARPNMPRNAFELGVAGLKRLKLELGEEVEIITAGAPWDAAAYGVEGLFTNLGKIDYAAVPKLYRSVDVGLMFMFSGHPGVTASELMASGCPVVVNEYDDTTWSELYQHEKTCLITPASASEVARNLRRCLVEDDLRKKLIDGGIAKATAFYKDYEKGKAEAFRAISK